MYNRRREGWRERGQDPDLYGEHHDHRQRYRRLLIKKVSGTEKRYLNSTEKPVPHSSGMQSFFEHASEQKITLFSSPFDETAVDLLESLNTPAYKVASFELIDLPLISYIARTGKPILMSTGMASKKEIRRAVDTAKQNGSEQIGLFHCIVVTRRRWKKPT